MAGSHPQQQHDKLFQLLLNQDTTTLLSSEISMARILSSDLHRLVCHKFAVNELYYYCGVAFDSFTIRRRC
jgi:hypothetical protein